MFLINALIFLAVLSVLIFVHELGHFLAAKLCNIYVDRFSIGMPPRLFGLRLGETDYCISALPIGGYVKMAGQEDAPLTEEEREKEYGNVPPERWFNNRPIWQRFFVAFAGPFMNFILAIVLYAIMTAIGAEVPESEMNARLGVIEPNSPAATAPLYKERPGATPDQYQGTPDETGWKTGDLVVAIDDKPMNVFTDIAFAAALGGEKQPHHVLIERTNPDDSKTRYVSIVTAARVGEEKSNPRFGVAPFETALVGDVLDPSPAKSAGIQKNDVIVRADGALMDLTTFRAKTEGLAEGSAITLEILRDGKTFNVTITPQTIGRIIGLVCGTDKLASDGKEAMNAQPVVHRVQEKLAKAANIHRKDTITEINGQPATLELIERLSRENPNSELAVTLKRPAILYGLLQKEQDLQVKLPVEPVRAVGVQLDQKTTWKTYPASQWIPEGFRQSFGALTLTVNTLKALVMHKVSPKELGGPLMIASIVTQAAENGWFWLLKFTAFISVNLCVFNLLPLPVLDGGLIVIHGIEGIRRKPLSPAFLERFQQAGLVFIIALMLFVTFNDVQRWFINLMP